MSLEISDLNDAVLLNATKQETAGNGSVQFSLTLPSGQLLKSEWVAPENRKIGLMRWLEAAREQITVDVQNMQAAKRKTAREAVKDVVVPAGTSPAEFVTPVTDAQDPKAYAAAMLESFDQTVSRLMNEHQLLMTALESARTGRKQWKLIHDALTAQEQADVP